RAAVADRGGAANLLPTAVRWFVRLDRRGVVESGRRATGLAGSRSVQPGGREGPWTWCSHEVEPAPRIATIESQELTHTNGYVPHPQRIAVQRRSVGGGPMSGRESGTNPSRFGILIAARLEASSRAASPTIPFRCRTNATAPYTSEAVRRPGSSYGIARLT